MSENWLRSAVAEAIGVFALCFIGILTIAGAADITPIALAHGLTILVMVAALGHVSGGHFNPAVTLGLLFGGKVNLPTAIVYWIAQLAGGLAAAGVVALAAGRDVVGTGTPQIAEGVEVGSAILLEVVATFFLVFVVFGTVVHPRAPTSVYPFAIGLTVTIGIFAIGPSTGGALNPARGFGPALVGGEWGGTAAWLIGPLIGGLLAWVVYKYFVAPPASLAADLQPAEQASPVRPT